MVKLASPWFVLAAVTELEEGGGMGKVDTDASPVVALFVGRVDTEASPVVASFSVVVPVSVTVVAACVTATPSSYTEQNCGYVGSARNSSP